MLILKQIFHRLFLAFAAVSLAAPTAATAQLFGEGGLFNREPEAPRTPTREEIGVPTPVTGRVNAVKGMEIQFELRAESKTPAAAVEFLIRTFPSAGKIVSLQSIPNKRNAALVTYYADPNSSAESDAFAFAVRYRGGRYSSAMRYDIDLTEQKSEVSAPSEIDFGEVSVGSEQTKEILVRNVGDGTYQQTIYAAAPFHLIDPADGKLVLRGRETKSIKVAFRPQLTGSTNYFLAFGRSKSGTTKLLGAGADPFQLVTETVELKPDPNTGRREGIAILENSGSKPVRVLARGSSRLSSGLEQEYFLLPEKKTEIGISLAETDTAPLDGMVQFYLENGYTKTVQVVSPVVPGRLELSIPGSITTEVINFGQISAGRRTEKEIELFNSGGVAVPMEFHVPEPFRLGNDPGPALAPGGKVRVVLELYPAIADRGAVDATMNVYGNEQTHSIRLLANVVGSGGSSSSASKAQRPALPLMGMRMRSGNGSPAPGNRPPEDANHATTPTPKQPAGGPAPADLPPDHSPSVVVGNGGGVIRNVVSQVKEGQPWWVGLDEETVEAMTSPLGNITRPALNREVNMEVRRPEDLSVLKTSGDSITLAWTAPKESSLFDFDVEISGIQFDSNLGEPIHVWVPYKNVKLERIDRLVKAELEGLMPNTTYEFRVFTVDENGRNSAPSDASFAKTALPMDWTYIYLVIGLVFLGALGWGIVKVLKDRRGDVYQAQFTDS